MKLYCVLLNDGHTDPLIFIYKKKESANVAIESLAADYDFDYPEQGEVTKYYGYNDEGAFIMLQEVELIQN